ncbi:class I SAM-dependent RNA methyltransferase [Nitrosomonas sp. Nm166]|uniref:class I SAM-dependent RNA methyltransferase n=1 Tax=Nitrosomonas sp. Nm166 TaxID=1881054 RepID=UPI0008DF6F5F|nr:class I SAM-dependent RNA methyltransferase [Nitrosomonas sp. Nm166]SFE91703.1 23S rRNA (uracil1939-C5)-methyltransferase [Nitrosomonas sp. Nm166]
MKFSGTITHLSQKGLGVVKNAQNNISYFVYGTWPGDIGEFEVINKPLNNKKFAYARLIHLTHPSAQRQAPACPYLTLEENACTGCPWMIADYTSQLEQKRNRFVYATKRAGFDTTQLNIDPIHPAPHVYGYRNRCQVKTDGVKLGFVSENSYQIAPINDCIILNDKCRNLLKTALQQLPNKAWRADSEHSWQFIELDDDMQTDEIHLNRKRPFKQGNTQQNARMQAWLREKLARNPHPGKVVELFCGSGNFTQIIAESHCTAIIAYESEQHAVQLLKAKNLAKVTPRMADLFSSFVWKNLQKDVSDAKTLVLDPPRAGLKMHQGFFASFAALKTIYYISCNPETFARDAWFFSQNGWSITDTQLIDLFPHTSHIEVLAEFIKK